MSRRPTKTRKPAGQAKKPAAVQPDLDPDNKSPRRGPGSKPDSAQLSINNLDFSPKKPSPEVKERVRNKLQVHDLQTELTKKKMECDVLREGGKQIREELNYQKEVVSQKTDETIRRLEQENRELSAELEERRKREGEMEAKLEEFERALTEVQEKKKTLEEEKKQVDEEAEELRKSNRRLVEETSAAKAEATETARRADEADQTAAQELERRQEVEVKNEALEKQEKAAVLERDELQASCKMFEEHLERMERERRERPSQCTQTDLRSCLSCVSKLEYKGDITLMETCSLLPHFIHGEKRNLIIPLRRKSSKAIDMNEYKVDNPYDHLQSSARHQTPPKPKRTNSNTGTKPLPSLLKSKKEVGGRAVELPDPHLTEKFNVAIGGESGNQFNVAIGGESGNQFNVAIGEGSENPPQLQQGQILVVDQQGDGYYVIIDENSQQNEENTE